MQTCEAKDIVQKTSGQKAWVRRNQILGLTHGYVLTMFDGPDANKDDVCACVGNQFTNNWSMSTPSTGTVSIDMNTNVITGSGTLFTSEFSVNDNICINCCQFTISATIFSIV